MAGYLGNIPSAVPLTSADIADGIITSAKIADGTIVNADINASSAIALSKLSTTGTADATTFLRGDGAYTAVSSDYVLLASTNASSSASVSFDGYFSSTYKNYKIIISNLTFNTDNIQPQTRFRRSNADVTTSHYSQQGDYSDGYSNTVTSGTTGGDQIARSFSEFASLQTSVRIIRGMGISDNTEWVTSLTVDIFDPLGTNNYKTAIIEYLTRGNNTYNTLQMGHIGFFLSDATTAISGITFFPASGNMPRGNFKLYGIK
jgi:hypothetical protein